MKKAINFLWGKSTLVACLLMAVPMMAMAQTDAEEPVYSTLRYGTISYQQVLNSLQETANMDQQYINLKNQYEAELKHAEDEFNHKYEEFLEGQRDFAPAIYRKRQAELQDLLERNTAFKRESMRLLEQAKADALRPLQNRINEIVKQLAIAHHLSFVLNTDNNAVPYVHTGMSIDLTELVKQSLQQP